MFFQHVLPFSAFLQPTTIIQPTTTYGNFSGFRQPTTTYYKLQQPTTFYGNLQRFILTNFEYFPHLLTQSENFYDSFKQHIYIDNFSYESITVLSLSGITSYYYYPYYKCTDASVTFLRDNSLQTVFCCTSCTILRENESTVLIY